MSLGQHSAAAAIVVAVSLVSVLSSMADARGASGDRIPQVSVRDDRGVYCVSAEFDVPQPASVVLNVLTDYEQIPRFMPEVKSSVIRERSADRLVVEQEAVARLMLFSKRIYLRLDVRTYDGTVSFRDASGRSFTQYEGSWRVTERDGRTIVRYDLSAQPAFDVPSFVLTRLLRRDANQMIERLRVEIAARARPSNTQ